jgi:hypothetical protein
LIDYWESSKLTVKFGISIHLIKLHASYMADLWTFMKDCVWRWEEYGATYLEVQMNSDNWSINCLKICSVARWSVIKKIKFIMKLNWNVNFFHVYQETYICSDVLTNKGRASGKYTLFFDQPPPPKAIQILIVRCLIMVMYLSPN